MARTRKAKVAEAPIAVETNPDIDTSLAVESTRVDGEVSNEDRIIATYVDRIKSPLTGIRAHCVACFGGQPREVATCPSDHCALHGFRMGKNTMHIKYAGNTPQGENTK